MKITRDYLGTLPLRGIYSVTLHTLSISRCNSRPLSFHGMLADYR